MNEFDENPALVETTVTRVDGTPRDPQISRRELLSFNAIAQIIGKKVTEGAELGEEYLRAKVAQESNSAEKIAAEAAEIASKQDLNEANADVAKQEALGKFISNLKQMGDLNPVQQTLALAKMIEDEPGLIEQIEKIESLLHSLRVVHGTTVGLLSDPQGTGQDA